MEQLPVNIDVKLDLKLDATDAFTETSRNVNGLFRFLGSLVRPGMEDIASVANLRINNWRQNVFNTEQKRKALAKARGGEDEKLREIPIGVASQLTMAIAEEDTDEVQNLWAKLIDEAQRADGDFQVDKVFIDTLGQLTPLDTIMLSFIRGRAELNSDQIHEEIRIIESRFPKYRRIASLASLERLRLIENDIGLTPIPRVATVVNESTISMLALKNAFSEVQDVLNSRDPYRDSYPEQRFRLTPFGEIFLSRCM